MCCDRNARAACAQSFALWQQATIEITRRDHSITAYSRHAHIVFFFAHIPFVVNRAFQRNASGVVATNAFIRAHVAKQKKRTHRRFAADFLFLIPRNT